MDEFVSYFSNSSKHFSILNFNIRSFFKNRYEFLSILRQCKCNIDIKVLTETWISDDTVQLCHIDGYHAYHSFRAETSGGGVSIFI